MTQTGGSSGAGGSTGGAPGGAGGSTGGASSGAGGSTGGAPGGAGGSTGGVAGTSIATEPLVGCGDGAVNQTGEECDDSNFLPGDGCDGRCRLERRVPGACGDGMRGPNEVCDDGNTMPMDGCSDTCSLESGYACTVPGEPCRPSAPCEDCPSVCGDGIWSVDEECDDGDNIGGYNHCDADCTLGPRCGDGITQNEFGEVCDDGDYGLNQYGGCFMDCQAGAYCGDGVLQHGNEICDDGVNDGSYGTCAPGCIMGPHCGDTLVQLGFEECDDGNSVPHDGCHLCLLDPARPEL